MIGKTRTIRTISGADARQIFGAGRLRGNCLPLGTQQAIENAREEFGRRFAFIGGVTSLTPQAGLELLAALLATAGQSASKIQAKDTEGGDAGFPDVLGDVTVEDQDGGSPAEKATPGKDPAELIQPAALPLAMTPQTAPPPPPAPIGGLGLEQTEKSDSGATGTDASSEATPPEKKVAAALGLPAANAEAAPVKNPLLHYAIPLKAAGTEPERPMTPARLARPGLFSKEHPAAKRNRAEEPVVNGAPVAIPGALLTPAPAAADSGTSEEGKDTSPSDIAPSGPRVQAAEGNAETGKIAFQAKLTPQFEGQPQGHEQPQNQGAQPNAPRHETPAAPALSATNYQVERKSEPEPTEHTAAAAPAGHMESGETRVLPTAHTSVETARPTAPPDAPRSEAPRAVAETAPDPPRVNSNPARDIRLEVNGGEQRVELRLTERAGEVHVAVRTPDPRLAGQLRENLPVLTSRLEHAGFRTETWHPSASTEQAADTGLRNSRAETAGGEDGTGQRRDDPQQPDAREQRKPQTSKEKGKQFAWLMSSLR